MAMSNSRTTMLGAGVAAGAIVLLSSITKLVMVFLGIPYSVAGFFPSPLTIPYGAHVISWVTFLASLALVVGVVGALTGLARSSLGVGPGRAALFLATWCSCMLGGILAALVSSIGMVSRYGEMPGDRMRSMIIQFASSGLQWGLMAGWLVALITVAVARLGTSQGSTSTTAYPSVPQYPATGDASDQR